MSIQPAVALPLSAYATQSALALEFWLTSDAAAYWSAFALPINTELGKLASSAELAPMNIALPINMLLFAIMLVLDVMLPLATIVFVMFALLPAILPVTVTFCAKLP